MTIASPPSGPAPAPSPRRGAAGRTRPPAPGGLRGPGRGGPPRRRDTRRPEPGRAPTPAPGSTPTAAPTPTSTPSAAALRAAAVRERERQPPVWFAGRLLLVLSGQRPAHSLLSHMRGRAYEQLDRLAREAPLRPRGEDRSSPALLGARGSSPRDGVIEAFARVRSGDRQRAMAFRLECGTDRRWRCAALELDGLPPAGPA